MSTDDSIEFEGRVVEVLRSGALKVALRDGREVVIDATSTSISTLARSPTPAARGDAVVVKLPAGAVGRRRAPDDEASS